MEPQTDPLEAVRAAGRLARLELDEAAVQAVGPQLEAILGAFSALAEVPVDGVQPLYGPHPPEDALRPDEPRPSLPASLLLEGAPEAEDGHYRVPRAVE